MKIINIYKYFTAIVVIVMLFTACDDDKVLPVLSSDSSTLIAPALTNAATSSPEVLLPENASDIFETYEWASSDYGVNLPTNYRLIVQAEDGAENYIVLGSGATNSVDVTVKALNDAMINLGLAPFEENTVIIKVLSIVNNENVDTLHSAPISRIVTPYATSFAPVYMIGDAVKGWDTNLAVEVYGIAYREFEVIAEFNNNGAFRFFDAPDWGANSYNWTYFEGGTVDANFVSAEDGDTNIRFIGETGFYRIYVNLTDKIITLEATEKPTLFMVGAAVPEAGWGWDTPVDMTWVQDGIFTATTELLNDPGASFRFFTVEGDWGTGRNYPYYENAEYDIDIKFEDAMDGDNNFRYTGVTGTYSITVNDIEKTIVVAEAGTAGPPKFLVGAGVPDAGWGWDSPVELVQVQAGVFEATTSFVVEAFRVFDIQGDWGSGKNYPWFVTEGYTIDANFEDAMDGDNNFKFIGTPGTYKFVLNANTKTITLN